MSHEPNRPGDPVSIHYCGDPSAHDEHGFCRGLRAPVMCSGEVDCTADEHMLCCPSPQRQTEATHPVIVDPDRACPHENVQSNIRIVLLEDTGRRQFEIRTWCVDCTEPFLWPESLPIGVDLTGAHGAMRSLDRQELRIAVASAADPHAHLDPGDFA